MHHHGTRFTMPRWLRRLVYFSGAACLVTGGGWLLLHTFAQADGGFGPEPNALEHPALVLHGIAAAALTWTFGAVWLGHVRRAWHRRLNRRSGGTMVALLATLALSGLGLYYLADEQWRATASLCHWVIGLFAAVWLPTHIVRGRAAVRRAQRSLPH